jgi:hypothetical protein
LKTEKYNFNRVVLGKQIYLLYRFARSLIYFREIRKRIGCNEGSIKKSWFWVYTSNSHLMMSVIDWCKIFGTDDNETHWKKSTIGNSRKFQNEFRSKIYKATGLNSKEWQGYHRMLRNFRNKYVAHAVLDHDAPVPKMDHALTIALIYDKWLREELNIVCIQDDLKPLPESITEFRNEAIEVLNKYSKK